MVIVGSGPAAHTAAIYTARAELKPVLFEGWMANGIAAGGQLTTTTDVENFPGFPEGILGHEICDKFRQQSTRFGTEVITETVTKVDLSSRPFKLWTDDTEATCDTLIISTGAVAKRLDFEGSHEGEGGYWNKVRHPPPAPPPPSSPYGWPCHERICVCVCVMVRLILADMRRRRGCRRARCATARRPSSGGSRWRSWAAATRPWRRPPS